MNPLRILLAFLYLFAASLIATPEANAFSVENRVGSFLLGTLDYAEQNASQVVELHREKRPVHYDALSGYAVAANRLGSLSNKATRDWYVDNVRNIGNRLNKDASLREQALEAFKMRTEIRTQARALMKDRKRAESLPEMPSIQDIVRRKYDKGLVGDDLWRDVIRSAQTPNSGVNKMFGID